MRELERKQKEEEDNNGSLTTTGSHQLIQNTSSTNSNHNSIHSGKTNVLVTGRMSLRSTVQAVVTRRPVAMVHRCCLTLTQSSIQSRRKESVGKF